MAARLRRSAGTNKRLNMLLFRKTRPEVDVENYRNGDGVKVVSLIRPLDDLGKPGTLLGGYLHLIPGEAVRWHGRGKVKLLIGPFELNETGGKLPLAGSFTRCVLSTSNSDYDFAVPTIDLPLVRLALGIETSPSVAD
ncbi:hypothetical protein [Kutzneria sp. NPDC052558]|uniref:hypothetical protein n=1 Tax=Kutzneria sp. NPDC052558 TaxID=3364121 RepID=UPI0037C82E68